MFLVFDRKVIDREEFKNHGFEIIQLINYR